MIGAIIGVIMIPVGVFITLIGLEVLKFGIGMIL